MKKPRNMVDGPRGDWRYKQPETGMEFQEQHPRALEAAVFQHRLSLPDLNMDVTGNWAQRLWDEICRQHEEYPCQDTEDKGTWPNLVDIIRFAETMWNWRRSGGGFVSQAEAERRANVCLTGANGHPCPHNRHIVPCLGCRGVSDQLEKLLEGRHTSQDAMLNLCDACGGCKLSVKVHFPLEAIVVDEERLPSYCWQRKTA